MFSESSENEIVSCRADLRLSRGGGVADFQNFFEIIVDFFRSSKVNFRALPKH